MAERGNNWCGAFGRVYMGMNLDSGELLVVKQVSVVVNMASKDKTQNFSHRRLSCIDGIYNFSHRTLSCIDGKIYRRDIVENAYDAGVMGVLIYSDRKDYVGGGGGTKWFPDDTWLPPSGVQVGSVLNGAGDPTTPGWPSSMEGCERLSEDEVERAGDVPLIPSLPISGADGEEILRWICGDRGGPGVAEFSYKAKQVISTIQNVIGIIEGTEEPDRFVILGNHRDAWTFGAVDPNSGTAALLEAHIRELEEEVKIHFGFRCGKTNLWTKVAKLAKPLLRDVNVIVLFLLFVFDNV
ncbi:probable glutamate carboxypeptidase LAMP1 [Helianthus annuus]|uniref:probable glutamate carboxypeptidase LAMP1 n=1 Tax=Helianthus annuus TaxID=4232 RepID=UPI001652DAE6|nr:probable glutamate carboxypeptidase LAMP1 [Helianthus annuus]